MTINSFAVWVLMLAYLGSWWHVTSPHVAAFSPASASMKTSGKGIIPIRNNGMEHFSDVASAAVDDISLSASSYRSGPEGFDENQSRRLFFRKIQAFSVAAVGGSAFRPEPAEAKSFSGNAQNLERLNDNDFSGGAKYDNNPKSETTKKRRALQGCKSPQARKEASVGSEKECNSRVLSGETEFMLESLRKLDCPKCPYGIQT
mmetsp:Transcript_43936/g.106532  ORF Transcript_43936/g.106532 Transcript_43936/m.106532 type:complete len:203 (-) Transcript_43936:1169-1777(-)